MTGQQQMILNKLILQLKEIAISHGKQTEATPNSVLITDKGEGSDDRIVKSGEYSSGAKGIFSFNPKIEFPHFDGVNPRGWIKKCTKYFNLCKVPGN